MTTAVQNSLKMKNQKVELMVRFLYIVFTVSEQVHNKHILLFSIQV